MSNDLNKCMFIGRLGREPELKQMPNGKAVANFSIACGQTWKDKNSGDKKERTEWVNIVAFDRLGEICGQYLTKGSQVYIEGKFTTRKWQDKEGKDRYSTEIVAENMQMLGGKRDGESAPAPRAAPASTPKAADDVFDDDIPF